MIFSPKSPAVMHIDLNSCFASVEQQANPLLRGKPVVVAAYGTDNGCIVAPSVEAKKLGIKVGMHVRDAKLINPSVIVLTPDPWKYRFIHLKLRQLISGYTNNFSPKSIDEFTLNLEGYPVLNFKTVKEVAAEIKKRIKGEIGDWLTVSIGIAPNRYLAKIAAGLHKPDGLDEINKDNFLAIYDRLSLTDLTGIKLRNAIRLNGMGIFAVRQMAEATEKVLRAAFHSVCGYYWWLRLHGFEIDDFESRRGSFGNSFVLPVGLTKPEELAPVISKLVEKTGSRLRLAGFKARGVHLGIIFKGQDFWHQGVSCNEAVFDSRDIYRQMMKLLVKCPVKKPVREIAVSVFNLVKIGSQQLNMFVDEDKKKELVISQDKINTRWGSFTLAPARTFAVNSTWFPDRIAFGQPASATTLQVGGIKELETITQL